MSDNQNLSCLNEHREILSTRLIAHVDELVKSFHQNNLLSESDVAALRKLDQQNTKVDHFMNIIIDKVGKGDGNNYFDKLIHFMRDSRDPKLSDLANKLLYQQDVDFIPCVQPVMEDEKQRMFIDIQIIINLCEYPSENQRSYHLYRKIQGYYNLVVCTVRT